VGNVEGHRSLSWLLGVARFGASKASAEGGEQRQI
jgi:hypothetical protein